MVGPGNVSSQLGCAVASASNVAEIYSAPLAHEHCVCTTRAKTGTVALHAQTLARFEGVKPQIALSEA
jgi:hypothetical protein